MGRYIQESATKWPIAFPNGPYTPHQTCIPVETLPMVLGALNSVAVLQRYHQDFSEEIALSRLRELQYMMIQSCSEGIDRVYRLIDTIYNNTLYTASIVDGQTVIAPDIPPVPVQPQISMNEALWSLVGMMGQGILGQDAPSPYPVDTSVLDVLMQIAAKAGGLTDEEKAELFARLLSIVAAL